jgi:hypothetical protein
MQFGDTTAAGIAKTEEIRALINSFGKGCTFFYGWRGGTTFSATTYGYCVPLCIAASRKPTAVPASDADPTPRRASAPASVDGSSSAIPAAPVTAFAPAPAAVPASGSALVAAPVVDSAPAADADPAPVAPTACMVAPARAPVDAPVPAAEVASSGCRCCVS